MAVGSQCHAPAALPPGKRPGTHCIEGWMGPRASLDRCRKSRPPRVLDPWTVQHVTSHYTDCAILAHIHNKYVKKMSFTLVAIPASPPPPHYFCFHLFNGLHCNGQTDVSERLLMSHLSFMSFAYFKDMRTCVKSMHFLSVCFFKYMHLSHEITC
jgi:hypothetical protein